MRDKVIPLKLWVADAMSRGLRLDGSLPVAQLPRFASALAMVGGDLQVQLECAAQAGTLGLISGKLSATVQLTCQRCLQAIPWALSAPVNVTLVGNEADEERLLEHCEPVLVEAGELLLWDLIEDEALLALPIAPSCANADCAELAAAAAQRKGETSEGGFGDNPRPGVSPPDQRPNPFVQLKGKFPTR